MSKPETKKEGSFADTDALLEELLGAGPIEKPKTQEDIEAEQLEAELHEQAGEQEEEETPFVGDTLPGAAVGDGGDEEAEEEGEAAEEEEEEAPEPGSAEQRLAELEATNQRLMALLNEQALSATKAPEPTPTPVVQQQAPVPQPIPELPVQQELSDDEFEELLSDKKKFTAYVAREAQLARQQALQEVDARINNQITSREVVKGFFGKDENKDMIPALPYILKEAQTLEQTKPELTLVDLLKEATEQVRTRLYGNRAPQETAKPKKGAPGTNKGVFAGGKSSARRAPVLRKGKPEPGSADDIAAQIAAMQNVS